LVLLFVALTAATCEEDDGDGGDSPPPEQAAPTPGDDPTTDDTGVTPTCGSAGTACMISSYEDGEYGDLFDESELLLANPDTDDSLRAQAEVFNTIAALRLGSLPADDAVTKLNAFDRSLLDPVSEDVLDEGLLEVYVVLERTVELGELITVLDKSVLDGFYERRPLLVVDLEKLVPLEFEGGQLPVTPSG
jgi:hypothetical protein